jgi:hypothetical protein
MRRLARGFQVLLGRRLEGSQLFAELRLAEFASYQGSFHAEASIHILEYKPVAIRPNHDAKSAADLAHLLPRSELRPPKRGPDVLPSP